MPRRTKRKARWRRISYPVQFAVDYPDRAAQPADERVPHLHGDPDPDPGRRARGEQRQLHLGATAVTRRPGAARPASGSWSWRRLLMILFRQKYPRWWFDWNVNLLASPIASAPTASCSRTSIRRRTRTSRSISRCPIPMRRTISTAGCRWSSGCSRSRTTSCSSSSPSVRSWPRSCLVRDPLHRPLPARALRLHRRRGALEQSRDRVRAHPDHRRVPAVPPLA